MHRNLREVVERVLHQQRQSLPDITLPARGERGLAADSAGALAPPPRSRAEHAGRQAKRAQRRHRYEAIRALHREGVSMRAIGRRLGCSRWLVRRAVTADAVPDWGANRRVPSMLDPFEPYLRQRWAEGCRTAMQLWRELRERGYPGSRKRVMQWVQQCREAPAPTTPRRYRPAVAQRIAAGPRWRTASISQLTWLLLREPDDLEAAEGTALSQMRQASAVIDQAYPLIREFLRILRQRTPRDLDAWFASVAASGIADLHTFADGLRHEGEPLRQALVQPYSNGISEGFVNKIKALKRQMFGRANVDLLRRRFGMRPLRCTKKEGEPVIGVHPTLCVLPVLTCLTHCTGELSHTLSSSTHNPIGSPLSM